MADTKEDRATYDGHCHCGTVKFQFSLSPPLYAPASNPSAKRWEAIHCGCSICYRNGYILAHPLAEDFKFTAGEDKLGKYTFARKMHPHLFCTNCGSSVAIWEPGESNDDGISIWGVNLRMVRGVDVETLLVRKEDGDFGQPYELA